MLYKFKWLSVSNLYFNFRFSRILNLADDALR